MSEEDLEACFALLITGGLATRGSLDINPYEIWDTARRMVQARKAEPEEEHGIVAIKTKRKYVRKDAS